MKELSKNKKVGVIIICLIAMTILGAVVFGGVYKQVKKVATSKETKANASVTTVPDGYIGIYNDEDLANVASNLSGNYILMEDIDMTDKQYNAIGVTTAFTGIFDGNFHTISNLSIESSSQYIGIFGQINNSTIKNMTLENVTVTGQTVYGNLYLAGLAGLSTNSNIENIKINGITLTEDGTTTGTICIGGLVGQQTGGKISNCYTEGEIVTKAKAGTVYIGGLIGFVYNSAVVEINSSKVNITNNLTGTTYVGGLIGYSQGINTAVGPIISKNYTKTNIEGSSAGSTNVGGLIGYINNKNTIAESYALGNIQIGNNNAYAGGLIGYIYNNATSIDNAFSDVEIKGIGNVNATIGGLVGYVQNNTIHIQNTYAIGCISVPNGKLGGLIGNQNMNVTNSYWTPETVGISEADSVVAGETRTISGMLTQDNYKDWDFTNVWAIEPNGGSLTYLKNVEKPNEILKENLQYEEYEGNGTEENPYIIDTIQKFQNMNYFASNAYLVLGADLDFSEVENFSPIGTGTKPFDKILNGNGHKIINLSIESSNEMIGIFGKINNATIKNVILENISVSGTRSSGNTYLGALSGISTNSIIDNIKINGATIEEKGTSTNSYYIGGLIGYQEGGTVIGSHLEGQIVTIAKATTGNIGGLVGYVYGSATIEQSSSKINIVNNLTSTTYVGGLIGYSQGTNASVGPTISKNYSKVNIDGSNAGVSNIGGLIGFTTNKNTVEQSYAIGNIKIGSNSTSTGGLIGYFNNYASIDNAYTNIGIEGTGNNSSQTGGLVGYAYNNTLHVKNTYAIGCISVLNGKLGGLIGNTNLNAENSYWTPETVGIMEEISTTSGELRTIHGMLTQENYKDWDFSNVWKMDENGESLPYLISMEKPNEVLAENFVYEKYAGKGTEEEPYIIDTVKKLQNINYFPSGTYYVLGADLDFSEVKNFIPIGTEAKPFDKILNGNGHKIINANIESSSENIGIFGKVNNATIKNITLENNRVMGLRAAGNTYVGGLAGKSINSNIENVKITGVNITEKGATTGIRYLGGLIGYQDGGIVKNSNTDGEILTIEKLANGYVGGLIGWLQGSGTVETSSSKINITNNLTGNKYVGGLIGYSQGTSTTVGPTINKNYSKVNIEGSSTGTTYTGGLIGYTTNKNTIAESYVLGNIAIGTNYTYAGGLIGYINGNTTSVDNAYTNVEIKGIGYSNDTIGGLVGYAYNSAIHIKNTYAIGSINVVNGKLGGLIGNINLNAENSYWVPETIGINKETSTVAGETRTIKEMLSQDNYTNWDFSNIWKMEENEGSLPYLISMEKPSEILVENLPEAIKYEGEGTEDNPFLIYTAKQLQYIIQKNKAGTYYYKLMKDIDASSAGNFLPIGDTTKAFTGTLDGNGYKVSNLDIKSSSQYIGMFGQVNNGTIKNMTLENVNVNGQTISGDTYVSGLAGKVTNSNIEGIKIKGINITENGNTTGRIYLGGLVGHQVDGAVRNSNVEGEIVTKAKSVTGYIGGLVGYVQGSTTIEGNSGKINIINNITNTTHIGGLIGYSQGTSTTVGPIINKNYSKVNINGISAGTTYTGGLIGYTTNKNTIEKSYAIGNIKIGINNANVGGLIGYFNSYSSIENSYANVEIEGTGNNYAIIGGLLGYVNSSNIQIINTYATGKIDVQNGTIGGLIGSKNINAVNSYWIPEIVGISESVSTVGGEAKKIEEMLNQENYVDWDFSSIWAIQPEKKSLPYLKDMEIPNEMLVENLPYEKYQGEGTEENPFLIYTAKQLQHIKKKSIIGTYYYKIMNDIDVSEIENFNTIGTSKEPFTGGLDGNGYKVSNLNIESTSDYIGMFGKINDGEVKNITLENVSLTGTRNSGNTYSYLGGLAGTIVNTTIENVKIQGITLTEKGTINTTMYLGGLVGYQDGGTAKNCSVEGKIITKEKSVTGYIGGLIGYANGSILIEEDSSKINITNNLTGTTYVGGLIGYSQGTSATEGITISKNYSKVNIECATGGAYSYTYAGGLIGYTNNKNTIEESYAIGTIKTGANTLQIGGLVGYIYTNATTIDNAYSNVEIIGIGNTSSVIGGLVGYVFRDNTHVENTYAIGKIDIDNYQSLGGLIGNTNLNAVNSYWAPETVGINEKISKTSGIIKTIKEMLVESNYTNWDFTNVWKIEPNRGSLPYLKNVERPNEILEENLSYERYEGEGTEEQPYIIDTIQKFQNINRFSSNTNFVLGADLDFSEVENYTPIGTKEIPFDKVLDGNGYKISNVKIESSDESIGLFGEVNNSTIKNIVLDNINIQGTVSLGNSFVGGLAGTVNNSIIESVKINGIAITENGSTRSSIYMGGLIGQQNGGTITNCYAKENIVTKAGNAGNHFIGGLVGIVSNNAIEKSYAIGNIELGTIKTTVGGLIGVVNDDTTSIGNSYSNVEIKGTNNTLSQIGGLIGNSKTNLIRNTYAIGEINVLGGTLGGLIGNNVEVENSYWIPETVGISKETSIVAGEARGVQEMLNQDNYTNWDFSNVWTIEAEGKSLPYLKNMERPNEMLLENLPYLQYQGEGTEENPFLIYTIKDLQYLKKKSMAGIYHYKIMNDIDASSVENFLPIGEFTGGLDGNGYKVSNLSINSPKRYYVGMFEKINNSTIKNIALDNINIVGTVNSGNSYVGGLAGTVNNSTIENVKINGITIEEDVTVTDVYIGGLIGHQNEGIVKNCNVKGEIVTTVKSVNAGCIGGLIGSISNSTIEESSSQINITNNLIGSIYTGGLIGKSEQNTVKKNYSRVNIHDNNTKNTFVGGLIGNVSNNKIEESYAIGNIKLGNNTFYAGGLIGWAQRNNTGIENVYTNVKIEGTGNYNSYIQGILGYNEVSATQVNTNYVKNAYVIGKIDVQRWKSRYAGGSYWAPETVGIDEQRIRSKNNL